MSRTFTAATGAGLAGELDAAIAQEVMGWHRYTLPRGDYWLNRAGGVVAHGRWSPTSNGISWERVFDFLRQPDTICSVSWEGAGVWSAPYGAGGRTVTKTGPSALLALCAALYAWHRQEEG